MHAPSRPTKKTGFPGFGKKSSGGSKNLGSSEMNGRFKFNTECPPVPLFQNFPKVYESGAPYCICPPLPFDVPDSLHYVSNQPKKPGVMSGLGGPMTIPLNSAPPPLTVSPISMNKDKDIRLPPPGIRPPPRGNTAPQEKKIPICPPKTKENVPTRIPSFNPGKPALQPNKPLGIGMPPPPPPKPTSAVKSTPGHPRVPPKPMYSKPEAKNRPPLPLQPPSKPSSGPPKLDMTKYNTAMKKLQDTINSLIRKQDFEACVIYRDQKRKLESLKKDYDNSTGSKKNDNSKKLLSYISQLSV